MDKPWTIVIPDRLAPPATIEENIFGAKGKVHTLQASSKAELLGKIENADAVLAWHEFQWDKELLDHLTSCKVLVRVGAGTDNIDLKAASKRGITVCNVPDYGTEDVADHTLGFLLSLARRLNQYGNRAADPRQWIWEGVPTMRLQSKALGLIGLGRIGSAVSRRAKSIGLSVLYYDPYVKDAPGRVSSLLDLTKQSDIISIHAPLTNETKNMIGDDFFTQSKPGQIFINTARGAIVDWDAFKKAFQSKRISAAAFDVLPEEPINLKDSLLSKWAAGDSELRERLHITPHCAFFSEEALHEMRRKAAEEALRVLSGQEPLYRII